MIKKAYETLMKYRYSFYCIFCTEDGNKKVELGGLFRTAMKLYNVRLRRFKLNTNDCKRFVKTVLPMAIYLKTFYKNLLYSIKLLDCLNN